MKNTTDAQICEALIHVLTTDFEKDTTIDGITVGDIISWLENQSTHESPDDIIEESYQQQADDLIDMVDKSTWNKEMSLSLQIQAYLNTASDELYGKGKPLYSEKSIEDIHKCMLMWVKLHNAYFYHKSAKQNPVYMITPKFKVGDFIKHNKANITCKVISVNSSSYYVENIETLGRIELFNAEQNFHIWTIDDARDGDVVVDKSDGTIGIFQSIGSAPDGGCCNDPSYCFLHCHYDGYYFYADFEDGNEIDADELIPATKEQRDLLFQKMKASGYEWDDEKKELTKCINHKFNVGDWICNDMCIIHIVSIKDGMYYFDEGDGINISFVDSEYHLWTIDDAQPGDVLSNGNITLIFKQFEEPSYRQYVIAYIGLDTAGNIQVTDGTWNLGIDNAKPATKEQRERLFAKMKEEGYTWNEEKKELTKRTKFKIGDWVVRKDGKSFSSGNYVEQVILIEGDETCKHIWLSSKTWVIDNDIRLWNIDDANDGDVLAFNNNIGGIIICKSPNDYSTRSYCRLVNDNFINKEESGWSSALLVPATKDQRYMLFKKMNEEGHVWDSKRKKLKKLENNFKFKIGDWVVYTEDEDEKCSLTYTPKKVIEFYDNKVKLIDTNDVYTVFPKSELKYYHLWTIDDAHAGDILSFTGDDDILISYKSKTTLDNKDCILSDFSISYDDIYNYDNYWEIDGFEPANKAQRDMLQKKMDEMKNNGGANKWTALDERMYDNVIECLNERRQCIDTCDMMQWLASIKQKLQ